MATGEQKWSSRGLDIKRFTSEPIPKGVYPFELLGDDMVVKLSQQDPENSLPRVGVRFEAKGTAKEEGQKNRLYFHDFYLSLLPGADDVLMVQRGGGIIEFARAQGDELDDIDVETKTITKVDKEGNEQTIVAKYLNPEQVMEYLQSKVGSVTEGKLTIEAERDDKGKKIPLDESHPGRNKMEHWNVDEAKLQGNSDEEEETPKAAPKKATGTAGKPAGASVSKLPTKKK